MTRNLSELVLERLHERIHRKHAHTILHTTKLVNTFFLTNTKIVGAFPMPRETFVLSDNGRDTTRRTKLRERIGEQDTGKTGGNNCGEARETGVAICDMACLGVYNVNT